MTINVQNIKMWDEYPEYTPGKYPLWSAQKDFEVGAEVGHCHYISSRN